jgi:hypothetical protein
MLQNSKTFCNQIRTTHDSAAHQSLLFNPLPAAPSTLYFRKGGYLENRTKARAKVGVGKAFKKESKKKLDRDENV